MKHAKNAKQTTAGDTKMSEGKVKWYDESKGFGFIEADGKKDIFVHRSGLASPYNGLSEGQKVSFDIKQGDKGDIAVNVK